MNEVVEDSETPIRPKISDAKAALETLREGNEIHQNVTKITTTVAKESYQLNEIMRYNIRHVSFLSYHVLLMLIF